MKLEEHSGSNDQLIVKGKRTKRPRPSSSASSTYNSSPATSSGISTATEEDEDMAHCLILLAQGTAPAENKFTSRKFAEMATTTAAAGKVGIYVYECKTCSRTFPSFQALGGHRASHKKPKTTPDNMVPSDDHRKPPSPEVEKRQFPDHERAKIHECGICGSEFGSGQALGGHMRRHRAAAATNTRIAENDTTSNREVRSVFVLDLNLPAPPEDENFAAEKHPHLVFSAVALVDCHY